LREKNEIYHVWPPLGKIFLTTFRNAHYCPPLQKILLAPKPVARFKSLGANTYLGGEEKLWAKNLGGIAPEFLPWLTTCLQYSFAVTLNIFHTHIDKTCIYKTASHKKYFHRCGASK